MKKILYSLLSGTLLLLGTTRTSGQALEPAYGAPSSPVNVCNGPATFSIRVVGGVNPCANGAVNIQLPNGFQYVGGSATVSSGSGTVSQNSFSGNTASLTVSNIPAAPGFSVITYQAYAGCAALANPAAANSQAFYTLNTSCAPVSHATSNSFNIQSASLSISNVTNKTYIGAVDDMYTRTITITNNGAGSVSNITLADTSGNGLFVKGISVSGGWNFLTSKTVIGTDTVTIFTLSGSELTQGQSISLIENVTMVNDCYLQSRLGTWFGCDNIVCETGNVSGHSTAGATINYSYQPNLKVIPDQLDLSCRDNTYGQVFRLTNTGSAPLRDLAVNLFSTYDNNSPAIQSFNAANWISSSQSAYQGFEYKLGVSGAWTTLGLTSTSNFSSPASCLTGMSANVEFVIPKINPGDTVYIRYNERSCAVTTPVNDVLYTPGTILRYNYRAACSTRTSPVSSFLRAPLRTTLSAVPNLPSGMTPAVNYTFDYQIPYATTGLYLQSGANGSTVRFNLVLPGNVNFGGSASDVNLVNGSGTNIATATSFSYNAGTRTISATYTFAGSFNYNSLQNSHFRIGQLSADCPVAVANPMVTLNAYLKNLATCTQDEFMFTRVDPLVINCPAPVCGPAGGLQFSNFDLRRTNYGLPDNDNNGMADGSGTLDMSKVRTNYAMLRDTVMAAFSGTIETTGLTPAPGFTNGYALDTISLGFAFSNLYARVELYSSGNPVPFYTSGNVPFTQLSTSVRRVDFSIAALNTSNPLPTGYTSFANGDSIVVRAYYRINTNLGTSLSAVTFRNGFYVSNMANPTAANQYACGNKPAGVVNLVGYTPFNTGSHTYTLVGAGTVSTQIDNMLKFAPSEMTAGNKPFIFEYRPLSIYDQLTYTIPAGFEFVSASVTYAYTNGVSSSASVNAAITPTNPGGNPLNFDINQLFVNGTLPGGDQGSSLTATIVIRPNCVAPAVSAAHITLRQAAAPGASFSGFSADVYDSIYYTAPNVFGAASTANQTSANNQVSWEVQITNASAAQALRVWMAKAPGGTVTITNVQRLSGSGGTVLNTVTPNGSGLYQLGNFNQQSTYYRITATYASCDTDSLKLFYGYDCNNSGYPGSGAAATYKQSLSMYVTALQPSLQTVLVSGPASAPTHDYCDVLNYELETTNTGLGEVNTLAVHAYLPGAGTSYVPGTFQVQYPAGSGSWITIPDASVSVSGSQIVFNVPASEISGIFADEKFRVRFGLTTSCDFETGGVFRFNSTGRSFCGAPVASAYQQSQQVIITGIPLNINQYTTSSSTDNVYLDCTTGELFTNFRFSIINSGPFPTTTADGFTIALPAPWTMATSSVAYLHNPSGSAYATVNGAGAYEFTTGAGLAVGDSVVLTVKILVPPANVASVPAGNSAPITESAIIKYGGTCSSSGAACPQKDSVISTTGTTTINVPDPANRLNIPSLMITNPDPVCEPNTIDITAAAVTAGSTAGLTYTYFTDTLATTPLTNPAAIAVSGTYYIRGTSPGGCFEIRPVAVVINPLPVATISYPGTTYCANGTITVTQTGTPGGTYSASPAGLSINASTGEINLAASTPGTYTITYSFNDGNCPNTTTTSVTIENTPTLVTHNPAPVCPPTTVDLTDPAVVSGSTTGLTYQYFTDAAGTTPLSNPSAVSVAGTYYIQGSTANGCFTAIQPVTVTFLAPPTATISYTGSPFCMNGTATVTRTGQAGGTYTASPAGLSINATTGTINLSASAAGTYTITYSFSNGTCDNTTTTTVTIEDKPLLVITDPAPVCEPLTVDITAAAITAGSAPGLTFQYFTNAAGTITTGSPSSISVSGTYYILGTTAGGCVTDTLPVVVTIDPLPVATINYPGSPFCKETGTISVVRTGQSGGTYTASPAGLVIDANTGAVNLTASTEGTYTITYSFTNGTCPNTTTTTIVIDTPPTVTVTDPARVCEPLTVDITAPAVTAGSTTGITFQYYSNAAGTTTVANPSAIAVSGTYYIRGTNVNGCVSDLVPVVVIIDPLPVATISYPGSPFCAATGTVPVTHTGTTGGTYTVIPSGLAINATTGEIDLSTSTPGTYTVTYNFTNGTCPNTTTTTVTIEPTPTLVVTDPAAVCAPLTIDLTSVTITTGSTAGLTYTYFSDAAGTSPVANPSAIGISGTYYIRGTTPGGCTTPLQAVSVVVNPLPVATISYAGPYCVAIPTTANVTRTGQAGGTYSAAAGLSLNTTTGAINVATSTPGNYIITYSFTNGTCPSTATTTVTIEAVPVLVVNNPAAVCAPATVDLTATSVTSGSTAGLTYSYYSDAAGTIAVSAPSAIKASGVYYIKGALPGGCETSILPVLVVINDQPVLTASNDTLVCRYDSLTLFASSAGNTIAWLNQPAGDNIVVRPSVTTQYVVTATSPLGCVATDTVNVQVRSFSVALSADKLNAPIGSTVLLSTLSSQSYSVIAWMPLQYLPNQTAPTQSYVMSDSAKLFTVVARSTEGCLDTASIMIQVDHDLKDFFIPNAMTPNGDGKNDVFRVYGSSIKAVDIRIYNSWGELLYQTNDNQKGWDGTYKGKKQPAGVYIYTVKATMYNDVIINRKGNINLLR